MKIKMLSMMTILTVISGMAVAQSDGGYTVPRTEYGQPDLQGVWNFSSSTPMQRAERYGTQEFLTPEQIEQAISRQARTAAAADAREAELVLNPEAQPPLGATTHSGLRWEIEATMSELPTSFIRWTVVHLKPLRVIQ